MCEGEQFNSLTVFLLITLFFFHVYYNMINENGMTVDCVVWGRWCWSGVQFIFNITNWMKIVWKNWNVLLPHDPYLSVMMAHWVVSNNHIESTFTFVCTFKSNIDIIEWKYGFYFYCWWCSTGTTSLSRMYKVSLNMANFVIVSLPLSF